VDANANPLTVEEIASFEFELLAVVPATRVVPFVVFWPREEANPSAVGPSSTIPLDARLSVWPSTAKPDLLTDKIIPSTSMAPLVEPLEARVTVRTTELAVIVA